MIRHKTIRQIALGVSLPTFAVSPSVAKATVYLPSHVAARMLGGRTTQPSVRASQEDIATDASSTRES